MYKLTAAFLLVTASLAQAQTPPTWPLARLRTDNPTLSRLVLQANTESPTFHTIVEQIHHTNAIVLLQFGRCGNGRFRACVAHLEGNDSARFVRIVVDTHRDEYHVMAAIAHELQHALELLEDPTVQNAAGVRRAMMGRAQGACGQGASDVCETDAALKVEDTVFKELHKR